MRLDLYANVNTKEILDAIGIDENKIPRMRGVGIEDGKIIIHTRTGGGNRESYDTIEDYVGGDYGIDISISEYRNALTDFSDYRWHIPTEISEKAKNSWDVPYEALYRFPETDEEWEEKEKEIKQFIIDLEEQKKEVLLTGAYTNEYLTKNKYYISDEDDDWDSTYANFWFKIPTEFTEKLEKMEDKVAKAALGNAKDVIEARLGGDKKAQKRIIKRVEDALEEQS